MAVEYTDGAEIEARILSLVREASVLSSSTNIGSEHYGEWPIKYHLSADRSNLLRHLEFSGLEVMEVGAGMGAISRYLAESCGNFYALEGTEDRFRVLKERLRDLTNWEGSVGNFQDVNLGKRFDVICMVGVLEYAALFVEAGSAKSPAHRMIEQARSLLKEGGVLLIAIENRLGLKYFMGCAEDHTGRPFDGICGYAQDETARTFSRGELLNLLTLCGFGHTDFYYPYPDYKLVTSVMSDRFVTDNPVIAAELASWQPFVDHSGAGFRLFPANLALESLADDPPLLREFHNSFLLLSSESADSPTLRHLRSAELAEGQLAWHYSAGRRDSTTTTFTWADGSVLVKKRLVGRPQEAKLRYEGQNLSLLWKRPEDQAVLQGAKVNTLIARHAYYGRTEDLTRELFSFVRWVSGRFSDPSSELLKGPAIDALPSNAFLDLNSAEYLLFDEEWSLAEPFRKGLYVIRALLSFEEDLSTILEGRWPTGRDLYRQLCEVAGGTESFEEDLRLAVEIQALASPLVEYGPLYDWYYRLLTSESKDLLHPWALQRFKLQQLADRAQREAALKREFQQTLDQERAVVARCQNKISLLERQVEDIIASRSFRIGRAILRPFGRG